MISIKFRAAIATLGVAFAVAGPTASLASASYNYGDYYRSPE